MAEMMPQSALVPDSDYVIIGGTGDLALRKIFPALFWRFLDGQVDTGIPAGSGGPSTDKPCRICRKAQAVLYRCTCPP